MAVVISDNCWDGFINVVDLEDEDFFDFSMESSEEDCSGGDWDPSEFETLGPIPVDAVMGSPPFSQVNIGKGFANTRSNCNGPINIKSERKDPSKCVKDNTGSIPLEKNIVPPGSRAFQLANPVSVLESSDSCSSGISRSTKETLVRTRSKRIPSSNGWLRTLAVVPAPKQSFKNGRNVEKSRKPENLSMKKKEGKKCTHCEIAKTPQWREGPLGPNTLCNACGVRYRSGRLVPEYRPAASPTFVPSLHSNSHRKVIEMRKKALFDYLF